MNSFNHYAYGAVTEWLYAGMAGIRPDPEEGGFAHCVLSPRPDTRTDAELPEGQSRITMVDATYRGIRSRWEYEGGEFVWRFTVPDGTARVEFPLLNGRDTVSLNGLTFTAGELGGSISDGKMIFELSAGIYTVR